MSTPKKTYFYSSESDHGSRQSYGFSNDKRVYVWKSQKARDNYIAIRKQTNLSVRAVPRKDVTREATNWDTRTNRNHAPVPFTGQFWGICDTVDFAAEGLIGQIEVCQTEHECISRFY